MHEEEATIKTEKHQEEVALGSKRKRAGGHATENAFKIEL